MQYWLGNAWLFVGNLARRGRDYTGILGEFTLYIQSRKNSYFLVTEAVTFELIFIPQMEYIF